MARNVSFEIYSFKNGNWMLDSVHDDKNMAIHQSRMLVASPHHIAVRVIEESYDDATDQTMSKIIYKEKKGGPDDKPKKAEESKAKPKAKTGTKKKKKKENFTRNMLILMLSIGGISLGLLALVAILITKFG
ncbi:MAG: hypothetical protein HQ504_12450 [Rhodospirillaceae bacterium]|nr:hypothetical protein [Rhodospirillaceae bacterium]